MGSAQARPQLPPLGTVQVFTVPLKASQPGPLASLNPITLDTHYLFALQCLGVFLSVPELEMWRPGRAGMLRGSRAKVAELGLGCWL